MLKAGAYCLGLGRHATRTRALNALQSCYRNSSSTPTASSKRVVIVGGVAGGATAAARLSRLTDAVHVTVIERSPDVSFANCGLPYYIGGEITDRSKLSLQTPESLSAQLGIKVLTNATVTKINRDAKTLTVSTKGQVSDVPYDTLILSPGASPLRPKVEGISLPKVHASILYSS